MSKPKFTPGPWKVEITTGGASLYNRHGFLTSNAVIQVDETRLEGESWLGMRKRTKPARQAAEVEAVANVHLMGTAPELYEEVLEIFESIMGGGRVVTFQDHDIERMESLLAKARGEL